MQVHAHALESLVPARVPLRKTRAESHCARLAPSFLLFLLRNQTGAQRGGACGDIDLLKVRVQVSHQGTDARQSVCCYHGLPRD